MKHFIFIATMVFTFAACGDGVNEVLAPTGEACAENSDCLTDDCRTELEGHDWFGGPISMDLTGGMCTAGCTWIDEGTEEEMMQADCGDGEQCLSYGGGDPLCFQGCETQEDCREDWVCTDLGSFSTCLPPEDAARVVEETSNKLTLESAPMVNSL